MEQEQIGKECPFCRCIDFYKEGEYWNCRECKAQFTEPELIFCSVSLAPIEKKLFPDDVTKLFFPEVSSYSWGDALDIVRNYRLVPENKAEMAFYRTIAPALNSLQDIFGYKKRASALNKVKLALDDVLAQERSAEDRLKVLQRVYKVLETFSCAHAQPSFSCRYEGLTPQRYNKCDETKLLRSRLLEYAASCLEKLDRDIYATWYLKEAQRLYVICLQHYYKRDPGKFNQLGISFFHFKRLQRRIKKLNALRRKIDSECQLIDVPTLNLRKNWPDLLDNDLGCNILYYTIVGAIFIYYLLYVGGII